MLALRAGADALYISGGTGDQQAAYIAVLRAVQRGRIPRRRLDQAVGRILLAKQDYGLIRILKGQTPSSSTRLSLKVGALPSARQEL